MRTSIFRKQNQPRIGPIIGLTNMDATRVTVESVRRPMSANDAATKVSMKLSGKLVTIRRFIEAESACTLVSKE